MAARSPARAASIRSRSSSDADTTGPDTSILRAAPRRARANAEKRVERAASDQTGGEGNEADEPPVGLRPDEHQRQQHDPDHDTQRTVQTLLVARDELLDRHGCLLWRSRARRSTKGSRTSGVAGTRTRA